MRKTKINLLECNEGEIVAEDIVAPYGSKLVVKNTRINNYIIYKLKSFNVNHIWVYKHQQDAGYEKLKSKYKANVLDFKNVFNDIAKGEKFRPNSINNIVQSIKEETNYNNIVRLLTAIKSADEYTYNHSINVGFYCWLNASWHDFSKRDTYSLIQAGLLHDIGKTKIPIDILNKPGKLKEDEFEIIKKHSVYGYDIVRETHEITEEVKSSILMHHERQDGSGYPYGLKGKEISKFAQIISLCDVYDALTSERVYKKGDNPFEAFQFLQTIGIRIFDMNILKIFMDNLSGLLVGSKVLLSNDKIGEIVYVPLNNITNPIISVDAEFIELSEAKNINIVKFI